MLDGSGYTDSNVQIRRDGDTGLPTCSLCGRQPASETGLLQTVAAPIRQCQLLDHSPVLGPFIPVRRRRRVQRRAGNFIGCADRFSPARQSRCREQQA